MTPPPSIGRGFAAGGDILSDPAHDGKELATTGSATLTCWPP